MRDSAADTLPDNTRIGRRKQAMTTMISPAAATIVHARVADMKNMRGSRTRSIIPSIKVVSSRPVINSRI